MSYVRPIVQVYQEYAALTTGAQTMKLVPCIIGPCYHCLDADNDPVLTRVGTLLAAGNSGVAIPNNKYGAIVELESLNIKFAEAMVLIKTATSTGVTNYQLTFADGAAFPSGVTVGCKLTVLDGATVLGEDITVVAVDRVGYTLSINKALFTVATDLTVKVYMELPDFYINAATGSFALADGTNPVKNAAGVNLVDGDDNTLAIGTSDVDGLVTYDAVANTVDISVLECTINSVKCAVSDAIMYIGYRSLRQDLTNVLTITDYGTLDSVFGNCNADNPLGLGVTLAFANTSKVPIKCIGIGSNDLEGYTAARDRLTVEENVYAIVPLSQDPGIIQMFAAHAAELSTPEVGKWRICLGSTVLPTTKVLSSGTASIRMDGAAKTLVYSSLGQFVTNFVGAGDTITIAYSSSVSYTYIVNQVITDDLLQVVPAVPINAAFATDGTLYGFSVTTVLDKTQQAEQIAAVSTAYGHRRMVNVWPDMCIVDNETVPGYFLGCVTAGLVGGLPSQQGLTRLAVAGVTRVINSGDYFSADQLDIIAGGGTCVFVQETPLAVPTIRHQLSTDMSTIEFREISFTKNFDYVCYLSKDVLDLFIGQYNITPITLTLLNTALTSLYNSLKLASLPKIGAPILGATIVSLNQVASNRGRVEIIVNISFPYVLNEIGLHLVSI